VAVINENAAQFFFRRILLFEDDWLDEFGSCISAHSIKLAFSCKAKLLLFLFLLQSSYLLNCDHQDKQNSRSSAFDQKFKAHGPKNINIRNSCKLWILHFSKSSSSCWWKMNNKEIRNGYILCLPWLYSGKLGSQTDLPIANWVGIFCCAGQ
jgi:hypothetical protein